VDGAWKTSASSIAWSEISIVSCCTVGARMESARAPCGSAVCRCVDSLRVRPIGKHQGGALEEGE
jgi:hypothetical protein